MISAAGHRVQNVRRQDRRWISSQFSKRLQRKLANDVRHSGGWWLALRRAAALALVLAGCQPADQTCGDIMQPPIEFDHPPRRNVMVVDVAFSAIAKSCEQMINVPDRRSCTKGGDGILLTVIPTISAQEGIGYRMQACFLHHEWGHINGWPEDHRGGRYV